MSMLIMSMLVDKQHHVGHAKSLPVQGAGVEPRLVRSKSCSDLTQLELGAQLELGETGLTKPQAVLIATRVFSKMVWKGSPKEDQAFGPRISGALSKTGINPDTFCDAADAVRVLGVVAASVVVVSAVCKRFFG